MVRGLYTAYTGMMNQQARLDVITNNLANASTVGYKKEGSTSQAFDSMYTQKIKDGSEGYINRRIGKESLGVKIGETYTDYTQGSFKVTGNTLDLALEGTGFFNIEYASKSGNTSTKYTRDGSFSINNEGMLVTEDGDYLLGENGHIQIPSGAEVVVDELGNVYADEKLVDKIKLSDFEDYNYLKKFGENLYTAVDGATEKTGDGKVRQGYLEMSNISVISEMVEMITVSRAYESSQKVVQTMDSSLEKAVNLGKL
mgnify:FL=1